MNVIAILTSISTTTTLRSIVTMSNQLVVEQYNAHIVLATFSRLGTELFDSFSNDAQSKASKSDAKPIQYLAPHHATTERELVRRRLTNLHHCPFKEIQNEVPVQQSDHLDIGRT